MGWSMSRTTRNERIAMRGQLEVTRSANADFHHTLAVFIDCIIIVFVGELPVSLLVKFQAS